MLNNAYLTWIYFSNTRHQTDGAYIPAGLRMKMKSPHTRWIMLSLTMRDMQSAFDFRVRSFVNTLRPRQNGRHFPDDIFKCIFLNENIWILIKISLKFVPKGPINNIPAMVQIMAWRRLGDKPLSEPMMVSLLTHICVTRPQWVNIVWGKCFLLNGTNYIMDGHAIVVVKDITLLFYHGNAVILTLW